jgi:hypothetical protein
MALLNEYTYNTGTRRNVKHSIIISVTCKVIIKLHF